MKIKYNIYSGAGNDFVMINNIDKKIPFEQQEQITQFICDKYFTYIDGVIFVELPESDAASLRMNYFNRDGSYGAMCGNGARCTVQFGKSNNLLSTDKFNLEAVEKIYRAEILRNEKVKIYFPFTENYRLHQEINLQLDEYRLSEVHWIYVGSEHIVVFIKNFSPEINSLEDIPVNTWGKIIRESDLFKPQGANVNFVKQISNDELQIRTYERGVERETLACGTGLISSAIISSLLGFVKPPVKVLVQSGEQLETDFSINGKMIENISLSGSAEFIDRGEIELAEMFFRNN